MVMVCGVVRSPGVVGEQPESVVGPCNLFGSDGRMGVQLERMVPVSSAAEGRRGEMGEQPQTVIWPLDLGGHGTGSADPVLLRRVVGSGREVREQLQMVLGSRGLFPTAWRMCDEPQAMVRLRDLQSPDGGEEAIGSEVRVGIELPARV